MTTGRTAAFVAAVLLTSAAAGGGWSVGRPFDVTPGLAKGDQRWPATAFGGGAYLVVEQVPNLRGEPEGHPAVNVDLVATRVNPATAEPLDTGAEKVPPKAYNDIRPYGKSPEAKARARPAIQVAADPAVQERHPALASAGGGSSLLVYSRRGGVGKFKIHALLLSE